MGDDRVVLIYSFIKGHFKILQEGK